MKHTNLPSPARLLTRTLLANCNSNSKHNFGGTTK